ncbi:tail fiber assembly protein [Arsenophonus nasoniae]|uniref:Tail fiber assembly protein n=1 Tax=Arsenophonus nasoniae TaxID=638 RepID=A0AA95GTN3_9GAMM|nr:tail fiber assembly protein [Arsenophonus nasoniae]WGM03806.1 tail fiber assembly protein [Arsenophonus nasoniae]
MKYYRNKDNKVYGLEDDQDPNDSINEEVFEITKEEAIKIANPPPTHEELVNRANEKKMHLIEEVIDKTSLLCTKLVLKRINKEEKDMLSSWIDYLDLLETIDTSKAPDINWPEIP